MAMYEKGDELERSTERRKPGTISWDSFRNGWALVTGASEGLGREFARQLAQKGLNLVLVARNQTRLERFSFELVQTHGITTRTIPMDLSKPGAGFRLRNDVVKEGIKIRLLCNVAAHGFWGRTETGNPDHYRSMIALNAATVVDMCLAFFDDLKSHGSSAVINVSSMAAYAPAPYMAVYASTKAFCERFSEALNGEWAEHGIHVQTLMPGAIDTGCVMNQRLMDHGRLRPTEMQTAEFVVQRSLGLLGRRPRVLIGKGLWRQRLAATLVPLGWVISAVANRFRPPKSLVRKTTIPPNSLFLNEGTRPIHYPLGQEAPLENNVKPNSCSHSLSTKMTGQRGA